MNNQEILDNVCATMAMEEMDLMQEEKTLIMECLEGKESFDMAVMSLVEQYSQVG